MFPCPTCGNPCAYGAFACPRCGQPFGAAPQQVVVKNAPQGTQVGCVTWCLVLALVLIVCGGVLMLVVCSH